ncbi:MAG: Gfo/Idh/MocA family oxidoreductase [Kiritimatiellae bacterium]|nr:Gfo/Idh/MocA family oxidoreductase [Kiritimatiellia bacterium]
MNADVNRREFVKIGVAGAAMAALPGILKAQQSPGLAAGRYYRANETVRVACVGYSDRFRSSLLPCFLHHSKELNFDMVAVADLWKKRLFEKAKPGIEKKLGHPVAAYSSDMALYEQAKDVDAVIISTADFQHAQHACHAVCAGKDAYCEKPLAEDMYSANMLKDAVDAKRKAGFVPGSVLQIGSQRRSGKKYMAAKEFINSGKFGDISYVDLRWNVNQPKRWRRPDELIASLKKEDVDWNMWLLDRDPAEYPFDPRKYLEFRLFWPFSSGTPGQWMCHQIDTVAWFMDIPYPKSAMSSGGLYQWADGRMSYDTFTTVLEYGESGVKGKGFQCVFQSHQHNAGGGSKLNGEGPVEKYFGPNGCVDMGKGMVTNEGVERVKWEEKPLPAPKEEVVTSANTGGDQLTSAHMRNWMECVRARKNPNAPIEAGYSHAIALIMANASARTGMRATFCPKSRQVMVGGKPFVGYASTAGGGFWSRLFG